MRPSLGNGKDVRYQNTEFRIQKNSHGQSTHGHPPGFLSSEFCILTSDVFAVQANDPYSGTIAGARAFAAPATSTRTPVVCGSGIGGTPTPPAIDRGAP